MTHKKFKLDMSNICNGDAQYCIIDTGEKVPTIYNDLGYWAFSSAPALCDLLNELYEKSEQLIKENEELKSEIVNIEDARQSYKQDWKSCVSYCDIYKDEIDTLKDEIEGLVEENEDLKNELELLNSLVEFDTL